MKMKEIGAPPRTPPHFFLLAPKRNGGKKKGLFFRRNSHACAAVRMPCVPTRTRAQTAAGFGRQAVPESAGPSVRPPAADYSGTGHIEGRLPHDRIAPSPLSFLRSKFPSPSGEGNLTAK